MNIKWLKQCKKEGFSYVNLTTHEALGGPDGSREVTKTVRRIDDVLKGFTNIGTCDDGHVLGNCTRCDATGTKIKEHDCA